MKILNQIGHQGDCAFFSIDTIPSDAKKVEKQFIAASERSGSFHALFGEYDMYEVENGFLLDVKKECILNHSLQQHLAGISMEQVVELPKKDHRHSIIKQGKYFVGIQQRFDPLKGFKTKVKD
jgi:hypothetical protein